MFPMRSGPLADGRAWASREAQVQIRWLLALVTVIGCAAPTNSSTTSLRSAAAVHLSPPALSKTGVRLRRASPYDSDLRYYPVSDYLRYPSSIRLLLRRAEMERDHCVGTRPDPRACTRRDRILDRLERRGWCWGSVDEGAIEAAKYWLRCSRIPNYRGGRWAR